jgi:hypothetical protein
VLFWLSAAQTPSPMPTTVASTMAMPPSVIEVGKPPQISSVTEKSLYWNDGPKSPTTTLLM